MLPIFHRFDVRRWPLVAAVPLNVPASLVDKHRAYRAEIIALHAYDTVWPENRPLILIDGYIIRRAHAVAEPAPCALLAVAHEEFPGIIRKGLQAYALDPAEEPGEGTGPVDFSFFFENG